VLSSCPTQSAPTDTGTAIITLTPRHTATPTPSPTPTRRDPAPVHTTPSDVYYANCDAVRAADAAPLHRGDPGYASHLDRDGDGVACE
jgi:hypothetical protein